MKIALDPYMFRTTPLRDLPGWSPTSATSTSSSAPGGLHPVLPAPAGGHGQDPVFKARWTRRGWRSPRSCRFPLVRPGRGRAPGRGPLLEAVHRDRSGARCDADELGVQRPPRRTLHLRGAVLEVARGAAPVFEHHGVSLALEPHPDDFIEDGLAAVNMIRGINSPNVSFLYCAPHTFHQGGNMREIMEHAGDLLTMVHVADGFDHRASSGLRYITNPPGNGPGPPAPGHRAGRGALGHVLRDAG